MKIYLVGGAVRDKLLNRTPKDQDYVVVGSTPEQMIEAGYKQVGADFPVFIHPDTGDEYALARTERKSGKGYNGFICDFSPDITLEDDLQRRDLTINSMAIDLETGELIDPFGGEQDLKDKVLRMTHAPAFADDPVRALRVARFMARYGSFNGWSVDSDTHRAALSVLMQEGKHLTKERVFQELKKALMEPLPYEFFEFLLPSKTLWFTPIWEMEGVKQPVKHHPEGDVYNHTMFSLVRGREASLEADEMFSVLCHDFGKAYCHQHYGNLHGHEEEGVKIVEHFCTILGVPKLYRVLATKVCRWHTHCHKAFELTPKKVHKLLIGVDAIRNPYLFFKFLNCCEADARGRLLKGDLHYKQKIFLKQCLEAIQKIDSKEVLKGEKDKEKIKYLIRIAQIDAIREVKKSWK